MMMKQKGKPAKKGLLFILASLLIVSAVYAQKQQLELAPLNPDFLAYRQALKDGLADRNSLGQKGLGFIPPPVDLSHLVNREAVNKNLLSGASFPSSYDLRGTGRLSPVQDQGPYNTCWTFTTYTSLESFLLTSESEENNFSENNLANLHGFDLGYDGGGNHFMATAYLARQSGPVNEEDDPYPNPGGSTGNEPVQKHVQGVLFLPDRATASDNGHIKSAVMQYGAVHSAVHWNGSYYSSAHSSFYYSGSGSVNHGIAIIGWDDGYSKSLFSSTPPGDGAFIVQNSWGTGWGEDGFFYVSYYDTRIGTANAVYNNAEEADSYSAIYQYDTLGWVGSFGYGSETAWFSNIFSAVSDAGVAAASFYTPVLDSQYEIFVYTNVNQGEPVSGTLSATRTGVIPFPGYHSILLDASVPVVSGQLFSVVVKLTTPGFNGPISAEFSVPGYSSAATANPGESFVSSNGLAWDDTTVYDLSMNVCLKAFAGPKTTGPDVEKGDINGDGVVNISDVILCLRMSVALPVTIGVVEYTAPYPEWLIERADMNGDGVVNISDVILVLRESVGLN